MTVETGKISDGYHTFDELYDHRITLFIALCRLYDAHKSQSVWKTAEGPKVYVWRSTLHSDGTFIDGWFVLGIMPEDGKQITYHLPLGRWNETDFALTLERGPEFDGHTTADVLERLKRL
jgi:hypothetical protein